MQLLEERQGLGWGVGVWTGNREARSELVSSGMSAWLLLPKERGASPHLQSEDLKPDSETSVEA